MKKQKSFFIVLIIFIIILSIFLIRNNSEPEVCLEENCFFVELAKTSAEKSKGLMFRESLESDKGMLFIYDSDGEYNFWMKNTLIPLDIIWIDSEGKIVYIEHEAQPCGEECKTIRPQKNARFILEINGGLAEDLGMKLGDKFDFHNIL